MIRAKAKPKPTTRNIPIDAFGHNVADLLQVALISVKDCEDKLLELKTDIDEALALLAAAGIEAES
jgi:hypothetical protein